MSLDQRFMREAFLQARLAKGEVPVGAVIAKGDKVIAAAHNQQVSDRNALAHAEILAIRRAQEVLQTSKLSGCTLYASLEPCPMCAGAIILSGLDRCVFAAFDSQYGCCGSVYALPMDPVFHHFTLCEGGLFKEEAEAMLQEFFMRLRNDSL